MGKDVKMHVSVLQRLEIPRMLPRGFWELKNTTLHTSAWENSNMMPSALSLIREKSKLMKDNNPYQSHCLLSPEGVGFLIPM